jgi:RND family efflux transporter MFP subunit
VDDGPHRGNYYRAVFQHGAAARGERFSQPTFPNKEKAQMKSNFVLKTKHVAWASAGGLVALVLFLVTHSSAKPPAQTPPPPVVQVASVEQKDLPIYREWIGTLTGQVNADIRAQVTGYLISRNYTEGAYVTKRQLLFEIDPRPFQAALDRAKGQLAQAEAQLKQDEAQLATAEANQIQSQLNVDKYGPLSKADAVSKQDFDNASQTNLANLAQVQAAKAAIAAAQAQIQANQAAVETASINLGFTRIVSPIDGIVGIAQAQVGDLVSTSSGTLTTISTLDPIRDYFTVSEQEYLALRKQLSGSGAEHWKLELILADGTTYPHQGEFYFADRQVNQNTGAIQLAALFANPGNVLRPGQYGRVRAVMRVQRNALLIPQAAVIEQQGSYMVEIVGSGDRVATRSVQVGERTGTMWVIQEGLKPGERVVVEGQQNLRPGMPVQPKPFKGNEQ